MKIKSSTCKNCGQIKTKNVIKKGKHNLYIDENNRLWLGSFCPDCKKVYTAQYSKKNPRSWKGYKRVYKKRTPYVHLTKTCALCTKDFETKTNKKKYCSLTCAKTHRNKKRQKVNSCLICKKDCRPKNKYCSNECKPKKIKKLKIKHPKNCLECNKSFS
jgi:hypothetical protein